MGRWREWCKALKVKGLRELGVMGLAGSMLSGIKIPFMYEIHKIESRNRRG